MCFSFWGWDEKKIAVALQNYALNACKGWNCIFSEHLKTPLDCYFWKSIIGGPIMSFEKNKQAQLLFGTKKNLLASTVTVL